MVLEAVGGVVHVLEYQAVHPGLQVDLCLLSHLVQDLRHPHGGGRRACSKIQKIGSAWKKINEINENARTRIGGGSENFI